MQSNRPQPALIDRDPSLTLYGDSDRIRILLTLIKHMQISPSRLAEYSGVDPQRVHIHISELAELDIVDCPNGDILSLNTDNDVVQALAETKWAFDDYLQDRESE